MDNEIPNNHKQVLSKDLNRETLFKLFFDNKPYYHFPAYPAGAFCRR